MEIDLLTLIGWVAAAASIGSFVAQALKLVRERDAAGISAATYAMTVTTFALWSVYGLLQRDVALIAANAVCFALSAFIFVMVLLPVRKRNKVADRIEAAILDNPSEKC